MVLFEQYNTRTHKKKTFFKNERKTTWNIRTMGSWLVNQTIYLAKPETQNEGIIRYSGQKDLVKI